MTFHTTVNSECGYPTQGGIATTCGMSVPTHHRKAIILYASKSLINLPVVQVITYILATFLRQFKDMQILALELTRRYYF